MNTLQAHLIKVAVNAIRSEAGRLIAEERTTVSFVQLAKSLEELVTAFEELGHEGRLSAICDCVRINEFRSGAASFIRTPAQDGAVQVQKGEGV